MTNYVVLEGQRHNGAAGVILVYSNGKREFHSYAGGKPRVLYEPKTRCET